MKELEQFILFKEKKRTRWCLFLGHRLSFRPGHADGPVNHRIYSMLLLQGQSIGYM